MIFGRLPPAEEPLYSEAVLSFAFRRCEFKEIAHMSDGIRRIVALSVLLLGTGLLCVVGRSTDDDANPKNTHDATLAANREQAAAKDPRLKGSYRHEQG